MIKKSVNIIPETSIDAVVKIAARSEVLGFDRCWVYDEGLATRDVYVTGRVQPLAAVRNTIEAGSTR